MIAVLEAAGIVLVICITLVIVVGCIRFIILVGDL